MMDAMDTSTRLMTFAEFEQLADEPNKLKLIDGELIRMPPAQTKHTRISQRLYRILDDALRRLHSKAKLSIWARCFTKAAITSRIIG
jgi:Uma2 family endonuclease